MDREFQAALWCCVCEQSYYSARPAVITENRGEDANVADN